MKEVPAQRVVQRMGAGVAPVAVAVQAVLRNVVLAKFGRRDKALPPAMAPGRLEWTWGKYHRALSILAIRREIGTAGIRISTFMKVQCACAQKTPPCSKCVVVPLRWCRRSPAPSAAAGEVVIEDRAQVGPVPVKLCCRKVADVPPASNSRSAACSAMRLTASWVLAVASASWSTSCTALSSRRCHPPNGRGAARCPRSAVHRVGVGGEVADHPLREMVFAGRRGRAVRGGPRMLVHSVQRIAEYVAHNAAGHRHQVEPPQR